MGGTISRILACYVMDDLLDVVLPVLPFNIPFIRKYVDDIILACPKDSTVDLLSIFNSYDPYIQFTLEVEDQNMAVPFLDTLFTRTPDNVIIIDWYRKLSVLGDISITILTINLA